MRLTSVKAFMFGCVFASFMWAGMVYYLNTELEGKRTKTRRDTHTGHHVKYARLKTRFSQDTSHKPYLGHKVGQGHNDNRPVLDPRLNEIQNSNEMDVDSTKLPDLSELSMIQSPEDQKKRDEGDRLYAFNQLVSDRLGFRRPIPDTRHFMCKEKSYSQDLPAASVVICFYNEAWSALLRTVYSVLDRSPQHLIHEIILVDDSSQLEHLGTELEDYVKQNLPKVKLVRTKEREGLIRARILGAETATGEVVVFLDSHCEVNTKWLEPLLERIKEDPTNVAIPVIDIIHHATMEYQGSPLVRGGFNWGMHYRWDNIPESLLKEKADFAKPIKSPTMAGGLFAMDRKYFFKMGKYDPGLDVWGGENLEISFRVWQCGGKLEIIPCSRVGHIFRQRRPYGAPGGADTMTRNSLRVAHVWMDEYKEHFFRVRPDAKDQTYGDISKRVALRKRLGCKSFKWYLETVYPEQTLPNEQGQGGFPKGALRPIQRYKPKVKRKGQLKHLESGLCVVPDGGVYDKRSMLKLSKCDANNEKQEWWETMEFEFMLAGVLCMDVEPSRRGQSYPRIMKCHGSKGSQEWKWSGEHHARLFNPSSGRCLVAENGHKGTYIAMAICSGLEVEQNFSFIATHL